MRRILTFSCAVAFAGICASTAQAVIHDVEIGDYYFSPSSLTVSQGDSIRWTNEGAMPHTVSQSLEEGGCEPLVGGFASGMMTAGDTFIWAATAIGEFYYYCAYHCPAMLGEVIVQESTPVEAATWGTVKALYH